MDDERPSRSPFPVTAIAVAVVVVVEVEEEGLSFFLHVVPLLQFGSKHASSS